jgi:hypothetical protein
MPETASLGTVHEAEALQFPQSINPVEESVRQAGWAWGRAALGRMPAATFLAPSPPYQPSLRMSMWYALDGVFTLKLMVWPTSTLIDVAYP